MLKGATRRVIEIQMPKGSGFDKALLYLSPSAGKIKRRDAESAIADICQIEAVRRNNTTALKITSVLLGITVTAFAVLLIIHLNSV